MYKILNPVFLLLSIFIVSSCNQGKDTSELYKKSQTRGEIIARSGTMLTAGSDSALKESQMNDAQNRLRTGGGLLGKKPTSLNGLLNGGKNDQFIGMGMPVNPYLWKASLETFEFMSFSSVDPMSGIIITDWYTTAKSPDERCKLNIFIKGLEFNTTNLKVNSFCQKISSSGVWVNQEVSKIDETKLENAVLNKAKKIRIKSTN
jgi:hypothetical protein